MGCPRSGAHPADRACHGEAVQGRRGPMGSVSARPASLTSQLLRRVIRIVFLVVPPRGQVKLVALLQMTEPRVFGSGVLCCAGNEPLQIFRIVPIDVFGSPHELSFSYGS